MRVGIVQLPVADCALPQTAVRPLPGCGVQDSVADLAAAHFVGVLMRLRRRLAPLLLPPRFDSPRDIRWHSAVDPLVEPIWDAGAPLAWEGMCVCVGWAGAEDEERLCACVCVLGVGVGVGGLACSQKLHPGA